MGTHPKVKERLHDAAALLGATAATCEGEQGYEVSLHKFCDLIAGASAPLFTTFLDDQRFLSGVARWANQGLDTATKWNRASDKRRTVEWVAKSLESGARMAHRWAKGQPAQPLPVNSVHLNPIDLLDQTRQEWLPRLDRDHTMANNIQSLYQEVRAAALQEEAPKLT